MLGVVDVGGGLRDIYGAGIFDWCMDNHLEFDYGIGVSAGSANITSYAAKQIGRNYRFYYEYPFRKEFMGLGHFLKSGSFLNLDYVYGTLYNSDGEDPLDYDTMANSSMQIEIVATDAQSGAAVYFSKRDIARNDYGCIKASCCLPGVNKPYPVCGKLYYDGGISDPIPLDRAFQAGCEKLILILTMPKEEKTESSIINSILADRMKGYSNAARKLKEKEKLYNMTLKRALEFEKEGKILILSPEQVGKMRTMTKDRKSLDMLYRLGLQDAKRIKKFIEI